MTGGKTGRELGAIHPGGRVGWGRSLHPSQSGRGLRTTSSSTHIYAPAENLPKICQTNRDEAKSSLLCADVRRRTIGGRWKMPNEMLSFPTHFPLTENKLNQSFEAWRPSTVETWAKVLSFAFPKVLVGLSLVECFSKSFQKLSDGGVLLCRSGSRGVSPNPH